MPSAACSRLCIRNSAWTGVFVRSTKSSESVIVFAGYRLLFIFFIVKTFSFIRSMDVPTM